MLLFEACLTSHGLELVTNRAEIADGYASNSCGSVTQSRTGYADET